MGPFLMFNLETRKQAATISIIFYCMTVLQILLGGLNDQLKPPIKGEMELEYA